MVYFLLYGIPGVDRGKCSPLYIPTGAEVIAIGILKIQSIGQRMQVGMPEYAKPCFINFIALCELKGIGMVNLGKQSVK